MSQGASISRSHTPPPRTATSEQPAVPPMPENSIKSPQRKSSFSFLRRGKSTDKINGIKRTTSNGKLQKKSRQQAAAQPTPIPAQPPMIPDFVSQPKLQEFGGENAKSSKPYNVPIPKVPAGLDDPHARPDSVTHRGRYSYASSAISTLNSPRRVRRRKDPTPFNILIVGARNSGKTSFGEFLRASLALPARKQRPSYYHQESDADLLPNSHPDFQSEFLETEIAGERIGLTVWDSEGLEKSIVDLQLRKIVNFIESKFDETLTEETKVIRTPGFRDTHIHCVILLLDPVNLNKNFSDARKKHHSKFQSNLANGKSDIAELTPDLFSALDESMDLQVLRALQGKTAVVPIISKADTITAAQMVQLKRSVYRELKAKKLNQFEVLGMDDSDVSSSSSSDSGLDELPRRHNHRRFHEADEDEYRAQHDPNKSTIDLSDSDSDDSIVEYKKDPIPVKLAEDRIPPLPLSVMTPEPIIAHQPVIGATSREFAWGSADPYNPKHCDFIRFKESVFQEWFMELREASRELWYEGWRTTRLNAPRARSATFSKSSVVDREPTIPVLSATSGNQAPVATPKSVRSRQSLRNTSGSTQQQHFSSPLSHRSSPNSPAIYSPQEMSGSPVLSYRTSPQPPQHITPRSSENMLYQKQTQLSVQQLLQQQQQQSQQRGYSPFQPASPIPQARTLSGQTTVVEQQEVGVAR